MKNYETVIEGNIGDSLTNNKNVIQNSAAGFIKRTSRRPSPVINQNLKSQKTINKRAILEEISDNEVVKSASNRQSIKTFGDSIPKNKYERIK